MCRKFYLIILTILLQCSVHAQKVSKESADEVYKNIITAIGNSTPVPPKLEFKESTKNPASFNPFKKRITIEEKVLEICYFFGQDSLNALAYILSHELAHSYCRHGWHTQFAALDFSNQIDEDLESFEKRIDNETQADVYAGFFSHIAGYNAIDVAGDFLKKIYSEYELPDSIPGYPSFQERLIIIESNQAEFEKLKRVYDSALISFSLGQYDYSIDLYNMILNQGFTSREIYNNLGLCYVYQALDIKSEEGMEGVVFPFKLDLESRLQVDASVRDLSNNNLIVQLLNYAIDNFKISLKLSPDYSLPKENIFYSQALLKELGVDVDFIYEDVDILELDNVCEYCVSGVFNSVSGKSNKALKYFSRGAKADCQICSYNLNNDFENELKVAIPQSEELEYNGFDIYCKDFRKNDCDIYINTKNSVSLCFNANENFNSILIKVKDRGDKKCISLIEVTNGVIEGDPKVLIGGTVDDFFSEHNNYEIYTSGSQTYYNIKSKRISYLVEDKQIKAGYYYERID